MLERGALAGAQSAVEDVQAVRDAADERRLDVPVVPGLGALRDDRRAPELPAPPAIGRDGVGRGPEGLLEVAHLRPLRVQGVGPGTVRLPAEERGVEEVVAL